MPEETQEEQVQLSGDDYRQMFNEVAREEIRKHMAENGFTSMGPTRPKVVREIREEFKLEMGDVAARYIRAMALSTMGMDQGLAKDVFQEKVLERTVDILKGWQNDDLIYGGEIDKEIIGLTEQYASKIKEHRTKALLSSELEAGAALIPPMFLDEMIELLRVKTVVRAMGAVSIPVPTGTLQMPRQTGAATAYYVGEAQTITVSQQKTGMLQFVLKKLAALTPQSNDLIRDGGTRSDRLIRDDLTQVLMIKEDQQFLRGLGGENAPQGIRYMTTDSHIVAANATVSYTNTIEDLRHCIQLLQEAEIPFLRPGWVINPRTEKYLMNARDDAGWIWRDEMRAGRLEGYPFMCTNQIPNSLGTDGDQSEVYFGDFAQVLVGEGLGVEMTAVANGTYQDGSTIISGLSNDMSVIRAITRHDLKLKYDTAFVVLTGVEWGNRS